MVGKEEIAHYEQFLLFPQCFQKLSVVDNQNEYLWSKGLNICYLMTIFFDIFDKFYVLNWVAFNLSSAN